MRSFLRPSHKGVVPSSVSATCFTGSVRGIFVRESWTPVTLQGPNEADTPCPARLLWQYRSSSPRHLTLCVRGPAPRSTTLTTGSSFAGMEADVAANAETAQRNPEHYVYGRLFLRPYNVAQLLTVLQGWSDAPALVERPRSLLQLSALPLSDASKKKSLPLKKGSSLPASVSAASSYFSGSKPRAVQLTARFTRKVILRNNGDGRVDPTTPGTDFDPEAPEDYPNSSYLEGEIGTLTTVLRDEDLVLLTSHLESVLSDFFAMEHQTIQTLARRSADREGWSDHARYTSRQVLTNVRDSQSAYRTATKSNRPQYRSQVQCSSGNATSADPSTSATTTAVAAATAAAAGALKTPPEVQAALNDLFETVEEAAETSTAKTEAAAPAHKFPTSPAASATAMPQANIAKDGEDEYEEIVEEVEADDGLGEEEAAPRGGTEASDVTIEVNKKNMEKESAAAAVASAAKAEMDDFLVDDHPTATSADAVTAAASTANTTSYHTLHTKDSGRVSVESDNRYATGRFVRDGSVAAAEVQEVAQVGDFDILHRTQQAQGLTEANGTSTSVQVTNTTGAFRSMSGEVKGTFAYQRMTTSTVSTSEAAVAAAAAATAVPVRRADTSSTTHRGTQKSVNNGDVDDGVAASGPTMEVKATSVKDVTEEEVDAVEAEDEGTVEKSKAPFDKPKRKRTTANDSKKGGKKKAKRAPKRKSASKATAADKSGVAMVF